MRTVGIVCEYNPFHNGHAFQLDEARKAAGKGGTVVCVMSGDFVQRGEAAVYSKFARAEAACRCGADLVVELPLPWCLSSAEGFARGAVGLLGALGVGQLSFGSETGESGPLEALATLMLEPEFVERVKQRMMRDETLSFAAARQREATARLGDIGNLLSQPNNILGVEYYKAIRSLGLRMEPMAIPRRGAGHDSADAEGEVLSASALRARLARGESVKSAVPPEAEAVFLRERERGRELSNPGALEQALLSRLRLLEEADVTALADASGGLDRRLYHAIGREGSLAAIQEAAKSKRYPLARVRRLCLCAALGVKAGMAVGVPPYARVLAVNPAGRALLRERADGELPVLTKPAAVRKLGPEAEAVFTVGARAHDLYVLGYRAVDDRRPGEDWRTGPYLSTPLC